MNKLEEQIQQKINEYSGNPEGAEEVHSHVLRNETSSLTKDVAVKFAEWKDSLTPAQKCTVHPPAGSGGSTGIYTQTDYDLFDYFITNIYKP